LEAAKFRKLVANVGRPRPADEEPDRLLTELESSWLYRKLILLLLFRL
jgi:hypothetical protein